jgi:hypothetical protein
LEIIGVISALSFVYLRERIGESRRHQEVRAHKILQSFAPTQVTKLTSKFELVNENVMHTKDGIAGSPSSPSWSPSNGREKFPGHLVGINTRHSVTSTSVIVSNYVRVPVTMISDEVSNPVGKSRLIDRLTRERDPKRV